MRIIDTFVWKGDRFVAVETRQVDMIRKMNEAEARREAHRLYQRDRKQGKTEIRKQEKMFIAWDGEGPRDTGYSLFGNSEGMEICYPTLSTEDCLNLIIETEQTYPDAIHIIFGGHYDASNILHDMSQRHYAKLKRDNRVQWGQWIIEEIPRKWFRVTRGSVTATIFDVVSFFNSSFVDALEDWGIVAPSLIADMKKKRSKFMWADIEDIRKYMRQELRYLVILADKLRDAFLDAGYLPDMWYGPGALTKMAFKRHHVYEAMSVCPPEVRVAAQYGFFGARIQPHLCGHIDGTVYGADIRSAYPYAMTKLPNLARGTWRTTTEYEFGKFGIYHLKYHAQPSPFSLYPLPKRMRDGTVAFPYFTEGWYWNPETALIANDPAATIISGFVFDEDNENDKPFAWIHDYYKHRALLKEMGNPAQYPFKLIMNAGYGQLAQRVGWDKIRRTPPRTHQLEWAGFITSHCRATIYELAAELGDDLIDIETDGIYSRIPIPREPSRELGGWELETYDDGVFWQSGMYALMSDGKWEKGKTKTRGIPKGTYEVEDMLLALKHGEFKLTATRNSFIGYGLALNGQWHKLNTWREEPAEFVLGGGGKVSHQSRLCFKLCGPGDIHRPVNISIEHNPLIIGAMSEAHDLPWLHNDNDVYKWLKKTTSDLTLFDMNDNDEWVATWDTPDEGEETEDSEYVY